MRVSFYKHIKSVTPFKDTSVFKVLELIKKGEFKNQIASIRTLTDKKSRNELKSKLPYVTFCGTFSSRANINLRKHSGLACLDFDNVADLEDLKSSINKDNFTFSSFVSPSGNGLKVLVKIPLVDNDDDYKEYYAALLDYFSKYYKLDEGTKDIARATYLSYDENLYLNNDSCLFSDKKYLKPLPKRY